MMQLYWAPRTRSLRALWMLEEAGVPYERIRLDMATGAHRTPEQGLRLMLAALDYAAASMRSTSTTISRKWNGLDSTLACLGAPDEGCSATAAKPSEGEPGPT